MQITLLPLFLLIFVGTVHIHITFGPVLIDEHLTSSWLLAVASVEATLSVPLFDLFFSILISCSFVGCRTLQTLHCLMFLLYIPSKLLLDNYNKDVSCKLSYFYPQKLVPKLLSTAQYHADLHILGTSTFPFSPLLVSP